MMAKLLEAWTQRALDDGRDVPAAVRAVSAWRPAWRRRIAALVATHEALRAGAAQQRAMLAEVYGGAPATEWVTPPGLRLVGEQPCGALPGAADRFVPWFAWSAGVGAVAAVLLGALWLSWAALRDDATPSPSGEQAVQPLPDVSPLPGGISGGDSQVVQAVPGISPEATPEDSSQAVLEVPRLEVEGLRLPQIQFSAFSEFPGSGSGVGAGVMAWRRVPMRVSAGAGAVASVDRAELLGQAATTAVAPLRQEWELLVADLGAVAAQVEGAIRPVIPAANSPATPTGTPRTRGPGVPGLPGEAGLGGSGMA